MADNVTFTLNADSTPPANTVAATDELSDGSHAGIAKLAISADGDRTLIPATAADGLLVNLGANNDVTIGAELPAGTQNIGDVDIASLPNEGQQTMANSISVAVASDQSSVPVTAAAQPGVDIGDVTVNNAAGAAAVNIQDGGNTITVDGTVTAAAQPGVDIGDVTVNNGAGASAVNIQDGGNTITVDGSVSIAGTAAVQQVRAATSALTTVADNAASVTILASNAARLKALITNDSSARLYLRFEAAAASTSNYGVSLAQFETWEEWTYTGEIRGIWATDPGDGAARITEFTA